MRAALAVSTVRLAVAPVKKGPSTAWYPIVMAAMATTIGSAGFFFTNTFTISYVTGYVGM